MERYRSGHNGADSKSVCAQAHEGSNPSLSAIAKEEAGASSFAMAEREGTRETLLQAAGLEIGSNPVHTLNLYCIGWREASASSFAMAEREGTRETLLQAAGLEIGSNHPQIALRFAYRVLPKAKLRRPHLKAVLYWLAGGKRLLFCYGGERG